MSAAALESTVAGTAVSATDAVRAGLRPVIRGALIAVGSLAVALGTLGIFLPLLPTTPFLLLAAFCYARSSQRFYDWLLNNRWFGDYIRNYREGRGVALRHKVMALVLLWGTIGYSVWGVVGNAAIRLLLLGIAAGVTVHLLWIKTHRPGAPPLAESAPEWKDR